MNLSRWIVEDAVNGDRFSIGDNYFISLINEFIGKGVDFKVYPELGLIKYWTPAPFESGIKDYYIINL